MSALVLPNAASAPRAEVPELDFGAFRSGLLEGVRAGGRVGALFGVPEGRGVALWLVLVAPADGALRLSRTRIEGVSWPSLTPDCPRVHLFEREISEQLGVVPEGHPWRKPVRYVRSAVGVTDFYRVEGDEVHEVGVGPVHAGVIEPGHFRFQCHGERVLHLEISLGYQHRGVERALVGGPDRRTLPMIETLAGDATVAHATAYAEAVEALAGVHAPERAQAIRGVALELERLANHTGNLGALAGDVGFLPTSSFCGRIRGDWLNLGARICGSRFGRGLVLPGGVRFDVEPARAEEMRRAVGVALRDVTGAVDLLWDSASVMARFEGTGRVDPAAAREIGLVGVAARACGMPVDVRTELPTGIYRASRPPVATRANGDVLARAEVRWLEIERSAAFVSERLEGLPDTPLAVSAAAPRADHVAVSLVEGWRGEVCHVALTGPDGRFEAYKVVDPSFHDWTGLALAMRDQQISDFPLCNKSFDLSYCGFDL